MFWVVGLFVTYQSAELERSVAAMNCLPYSRSAGNEMTATAGNTGWITVITTRNAAMKKIVRQNE